LTFFFLVISRTFSLERLKTHDDISSNYNWVGLCVNNYIPTDVKSTFEITSANLSPSLPLPRHQSYVFSGKIKNTWGHFF
jgi:hypothetical protein